MLSLRKQASETLNDVSDASRKVVDTTEWAAMALIAVTLVSVAALAIAVLALERATYDHS